MSGSSPRMRGTPFPHLRFVVPVGIIPAHAGNTKVGSPNVFVSRDHPRACGEHVDGASHDVGAEGSSPRMRGTRQTVHRLRRPAGIIPAHAGNTSRPCMMPSLVQDHPRACGEHYRTGVVPFAVSGSSPRMRGTQHVCWYFCVIHGIIPAHAGNTKFKPKKTTDDWDHPRACGEHCPRNSRVCRSSGSSPRMRGTLGDRNISIILAGIIPAHAGNTGMFVARARLHRDHPRACGEHNNVCTPPTSCSGSSPRMRGTLLSCDPDVTFSGIIPAHAGNTRSAIR